MRKLLPKTTNRIIISISLLIMVIISVNCTGLKEPPRPETFIKGDYTYLKDYISYVIMKKMKALNITGASIAFIDEGEIIWSEGFGYADRGNDIKATPQTVYGVGSVSKLFTATAIMQLAEKRKLDIDKPITEYIPELNINTRFKDAPPITVRMLMTHHSGLPGDKSKYMFGKELKETYHDEIDYLNSVHTAYPPNYLWSYSNIGVDMMGIIVERISGMSFPDYVDENILKPLGMNDTSFLFDDDIIEKHSKGYFSESGEEFDGFIKIRSIPAGSLKSNVLDMSRFIMMAINGGSLEDKQVLKSETLEEMWTVQNEDVALDFDFKIGLNWFLSTNGLDYAGKVCSHGGDTIFYHAQLSIIPEHNMGVIVLCNTDNGYLFSPDVAKKTLKLAVEMKEGILPPEPTEPPKEITLTKEELEEYEGFYATSLGLITISSMNTTLKVNMMGKDIILIPNEDGWFSIKGDKRIRISIQDIDGERIFIIDADGMKWSMGKKYLKEDIPTSWQNRVGVYEEVDPEIEIVEMIKGELLNPVIKFEDDMLLLTYKDIINWSIVLSPVNDNEVISLGLGRGYGETIYIRDVEGQEVLDISGSFYNRADQVITNLISDTDSITSSYDTILSPMDIMVNRIADILADYDD